MSQKKKFPQGYNFRLIFRIVALVASFLAVDILYSQVIHPKAEEAAIMESMLAEDSLEEAGQARRSLPVILKDAEQQICMSLLFWAFFLLIEKQFVLSGERKCLDETFIKLSRGERIIPSNALAYFREVREKSEGDKQLKGKLLPTFLMNGLHRFHSTNSISAVSESIQQDSGRASDQLESDLSLVRYIGWAIPSIGFIGTVRGIGEALAQAQQAIEGDISGVTSSLGLAFNSTLVALLFSIILTFFLYMIQASQENMILKISRYCQEKLINSMKVPTTEETASLGSGTESDPLAQTLS